MTRQEYALVVVRMACCLTTAPSKPHMTLQIERLQDIPCFRFTNIVVKYLLSSQTSFCWPEILRKEFSTMSSLYFSSLSLVRSPVLGLPPSWKPRCGHYNLKNFIQPNLLLLVTDFIVIFNSKCQVWDIFKWKLTLQNLPQWCDLCFINISLLNWLLQKFIKFFFAHNLFQ